MSNTMRKSSDASAAEIISRGSCEVRRHTPAISPESILMARKHSDFSRAFLRYNYQTHF
jgi:hypothetical protein